jgi:single-stranded DNA-specific DHH superfamily exonuclease
LGGHAAAAGLALAAENYAAFATALDVVVREWRAPGVL